MWRGEIKKLKYKLCKSHLAHLLGYKTRITFMRHGEGG